jgi:hypothetical protein
MNPESGQVHLFAACRLNHQLNVLQLNAAAWEYLDPVTGIVNQSFD